MKILQNNVDTSISNGCFGATPRKLYLNSIHKILQKVGNYSEELPQIRETLVNQGFPTHKKITVPTAPMSVKTVIVSARSGVRTLDTLIKSQVLYQLS